jgi:hypothetical protein
LTARRVKKRFDKQLYDMVNESSIAAGKKYLKSIGHRITSTKEDMKVDIRSTLNGKPHLTEVEVKLVWDGEWPSHWKDIQLPERKRRLIEYAKNNEKELSFLIFNKSFTSAWKVDSNIIEECELKEVPNRYAPSGEYFFIVPTEKAELITL